MRLKGKTLYYYVASIHRGDGPAVRQGTLWAPTELEAVDMVYELGRTVWQRSVVEVTIMNGADKTVLAHSKLGDKVGPKLLPKPTEEPKEEPKRQAGFTANWEPVNRPFYPGDVGKYYAAPTFACISQFEP